MKLSKAFLYSFTLTVGMCTGFVAVAWTGPLSAAPSCTTGNPGCDAPLNVSATAQSKAGGLVLNTGGATNGLITYGNMGLGTAGPNPLGGAPSAYGRVLTIANPTAGARALLELWTNAAPTAGQAIGQISFLSGTAPATGPAAAIASLSNGVTANSGDLRFYTSSTSGGTTQRMVIDPTGIVRIGVIDAYPSANLVINTNTTWAAIANYNNGAPAGAYGIYTYGSTYALYANGPVYGSAFYYTSDARLKKNVQTIASSTALAKVLALNPVTFNWIASDKPQGTQIGFIAQEVEKVVPELVLTDASTTQKSVDYARVVPLLVGAVQAQQKEIEDLKAEVEALKAAR